MKKKLKLISAGLFLAVSLAFLGMRLGFASIPAGTINKIENAVIWAGSPPAPVSSTNPLPSAVYNSNGQQVSSTNPFSVAVTNAGPTNPLFTFPTMQFTGTYVPVEISFSGTTLSGISACMQETGTEQALLLITKAQFSTVLTASGTAEFYLNYYSTAPTGGTVSSTIYPVGWTKPVNLSSPFTDTNYPVSIYSASPTAGNLSGSLVNFYSNIEAVTGGNASENTPDYSFPLGGVNITNYTSTSGDSLNVCFGSNTAGEDYTVNLRGYEIP